MAPLKILLLTVISLLVASGSQGASPDTGLPLNQHSDSTKRLLRTHDRSYRDGNDEERGVTAGLEQLSNSLKSTTTKRLKTWLEAGKSTDDVFKLLTLDNIADDLLANPQLQAWINYMRLFNSKNPKQQSTLIKTLTSHYGDDGVAKIIETAKQVPATATVAKRLQTEQIQRWITQDISPDDVFKLLKLNKAGDKLFEQPQVVTWAKYLDDFNKVHPDQKTTLISTLTKYDEQTMVDMLVAAHKVPTTEQIAVRIQADLTNAWLTKQKSPTDIFKMLKLNTEGDTLLENSLFIAWTKYTDYYNLMYHKETIPVISTLTKYFSNKNLASMLVAASKNPNSEDLATQLQRDLLKYWLSEGNAPSYVFRRLQLEKTGEKLFDSPILNTWVLYVEYFRKENPTRKVNMLSILKEHYKHDGVLANMLVEATKVDSTQKIAANLLDSLTLRWMYNKKPPTSVYKWLRVQDRPEDTAVWRIYSNYDELYKLKYAA
ncbi:hypothetical protein L914_14286 [Phytophthora nicotianae]|uniref:RxLR effector PexRD54 WY domain-containing protein n=1 Tax=Phytophthora nicotianae TaxID=4792 RepID=W2MT65_PHYNI|nr:hypothetical protein L916_14350 [Phytophthora nicotianae]ETM39572.1 hypothetical protein L914_14286 [Phytophthora nicotianae]